MGKSTFQQKLKQYTFLLVARRILPFSMKNMIDLRRKVFFYSDIKFSSEKSVPITYVVNCAMNFNKSQDQIFLLVNAAKTPLGFNSSNGFRAHDFSINYSFKKERSDSINNRSIFRKH